MELAKESDEKTESQVSSIFMGRGRAIAPTGFTQNYSKRIGDESKDIDESDEKQGNPMETGESGGPAGIRWNRRILGRRIP
jgi:hypothetical protein